MKAKPLLWQEVRIAKHPKCKGHYDEWNGDYDCGYRSDLSCEDCKYGLGRKDPEAECNRG